MDWVPNQKEIGLSLLRGDPKKSEKEKENTVGIIKIDKFNRVINNL